jgi:hypothetical protein
MAERKLIKKARAADETFNVFSLASIEEVG